ncbi:MAG: DUF559 domain-containing protein [Nitrospirae bacterium]|nr:DUF559 domain-containing protein [Nitrospirota bacterium]
MTKRLMHLARWLRKRTTDVEQLLWESFRAGCFEGMKFKGEASYDSLPSIPSPQGRGSNYPLEMRKNHIF